MSSSLPIKLQLTFSHLCENLSLATSFSLLFNFSTLYNLLTLVNCLNFKTFKWK